MVQHGFRPNGPHNRRTQQARKERLLATACVRQVWYLLNDPVARDAVSTAEAFADGRATEKQLHFAAALLDADGVRWDDAPDRLCGSSFSRRSF
jgi:hypothetical protein